MAEEALQKVAKVSRTGLGRRRGRGAMPRPELECTNPGCWLRGRGTLTGAGSVGGGSGATPAGGAEGPDPNRWLRGRETLAGAGGVGGGSGPAPAGGAVLG